MTTTDFAAFFTGPNAPAAATTLGFRFVDAREGFTNPAGRAKGGFLAAMRDDTMGSAILVKRAKLLTGVISVPGAGGEDD